MVHNVHLVHVEVETSRCIGDHQRIYAEVKALPYLNGFRELATDRPPDQLQFNALFVRAGPPAKMHRNIERWLALARLRYLVPRAVLLYTSMRTAVAKRG